MSEEERLYAVVQRVIDGCSLVREVSPSWVATEVMSAIRFPRQLHELGYIGCHLEVRQIARHKLRRMHDPEERIRESLDQGELQFPDTLQDRYPRRQQPGEEPRYILREWMEETDVTFNVERMRRAGRALLKHADALEAWHAGRRAAG